MGGKIVVPETDPNLLRVTTNFDFTPRDISEFWRIFEKIDVDGVGVVSLDAIFKLFHAKRNVFTDSLLDLLDIEHDGEINFSDFLLMVTSYCFFEHNEILRFCFYVFDKDQTGYFSVDDLNRLMNIVHNVKAGKTITGAAKASWQKIKFETEDITFEQFAKIHNAFPRIFEPAFQLQHHMIAHTMGSLWWDHKKQVMQSKRDEAASKLAAIKAEKERRKEERKNRKIKKKMGLFRFYLCPCMRDLFDPTKAPIDHLSEKERAEKEREFQRMKREAELKIKNPETVHWLKYQKKVIGNEVNGDIDKIIEAELEAIEEDVDHSSTPVYIQAAMTAISPSEKLESSSCVELTRLSENHLVTRDPFGKKVAQPYVFERMKLNDIYTNDYVHHVKVPPISKNQHGTERFREDRMFNRADRREFRRGERQMKY